MSKKFSLVKHALGYYEVTPKPSIDELNEYYSKKYFQQNNSVYEQTYSEEELRYFNVDAELAIKTIQRFSKFSKRQLLDLGSGEGFFANYFYKQGWKVNLVDFSDDGLQRHNPSLLPNFEQADLLTYLDSKKEEIKAFDLINLDNVLEHVIDPIDLLRKLKNHMSSDALLRIEIPNDFSPFQSLLTNMGCIEENWVLPPEHLNYFNSSSLKSLLESEGFNLLSLQADFPIELFLLNKHSNYWKNRSLGKDAHLTRVLVTNYMAETNIERMIDYQEAAADLEFGRLLTAYVKVAY